MDSDDAAFLRAIIAAPDDDAPRLVYADWLDENGQPERAEFIRVQCELATLADVKDCTMQNCPTCARVLKLMDRDRELVNAHGSSWVGIADEYVLNRDPFCRGFVESLYISAADWLAHADAICERHPVREVRLTTWFGLDVSGHLVRLAGTKEWVEGLQTTARTFPHRTDMILAERRWPGITFHLPASTPQSLPLATQPNRAGRASASTR